MTDFNPGAHPRGDAGRFVHATVSEQPDGTASLSSAPTTPRSCVGLDGIVSYDTRDIFGSQPADDEETSLAAKLREVAQLDGIPAQTLVRNPRELELTPIQCEVEVEVVTRYIADIESGVIELLSIEEGNNDLPLLVSACGKTYIIDGHHRLAAAILANRPIAFEVFELPYSARLTRLKAELAWELTSVRMHENVMRDSAPESSRYQLAASRVIANRSQARLLESEIARESA